MENTHELVMQSLVYNNVVPLGKDFVISDSLIKEFLITLPDDPRVHPRAGSN